MGGKKRKKNISGPKPQLYGSPLVKSWFKRVSHAGLSDFVVRLMREITLRADLDGAKLIEFTANAYKAIADARGERMPRLVTRVEQSTDGKATRVVTRPATYKTPTYKYFV